MKKNQGSEFGTDTSGQVSAGLAPTVLAVEVPTDSGSRRGVVRLSLKIATMIALLLTSMSVMAPTATVSANEGATSSGRCPSGYFCVARVNYSGYTNPASNGTYSCGASSACSIFSFYDKDSSYVLDSFPSNGFSVSNNSWAIRNRWTSSTFPAICAWDATQWSGGAMYRMPTSYPGWWDISNHVLSSHHPSVSTSSCPSF